MEKHMAAAALGLAMTAAPFPAFSFEPPADRPDYGKIIAAQQKCPGGRDGCLRMSGDPPITAAQWGDILAGLGPNELRIMQRRYDVPQGVIDQAAASPAGKADPAGERTAPERPEGGTGAAQRGAVGGKDGGSGSARAPGRAGAPPEGGASGVERGEVGRGEAGGRFAGQGKSMSALQRNAGEVFGPAPQDVDSLGPGARPRGGAGRGPEGPPSAEAGPPSEAAPSPRWTASPSPPAGPAGQSSAGREDPARHANRGSMPDLMIRGRYSAAAPPPPFVQGSRPERSSYGPGEARNAPPAGAKAKDGEQREEQDEDEGLGDEELAELAEIRKLLRESAESGELDAEALASELEGSASTKGVSPSVQAIRQRLRGILARRGREHTEAEVREVMALASRLGLSKEDARKILAALRRPVPSPQPARPSFWRRLLEWLRALWRGIFGR